LNQYNNEKIFIIILNWNGLEDTIACIDSLQQSKYKNFKIVLIENGSNDNSANVLKIMYPEIHVIENKQNLGFCEGNNQGIEYSICNGADFVWLLNNDTIVLQDTLNLLVENAKSSPKIGMISPVIRYNDQKEKIQYGGCFIDRKRFLLNYPKKNEEFEYDYTSGENVILWGTALLIRVQVLRDIGLLNSEFFAYWEDVDICLRAIEKGYLNIVCTNAVVYHKRKLLPNKKEVPKKGMFYYLFERNYLLLVKSHSKNLIKRFKNILRGIAICSSHLKNCPQKYRYDSILGIWHGLNGNGGYPNEKKNVPKSFVFIIKIFSHIYPLFLINVLLLDIKMILIHIKKILTKEK